MPTKPRRRRCLECGIVHEPCSECGLTYHTSDWPWCPHGSTRRTLSQIEPVVVFRTKSGEIRIPGSNTKPTPRGCERIEIRDIATLARFDRDYREQLRTESADLRAKHDAAFDAYTKDRRSELRQAMQHMHPFARALAELAMKRNDEKRSKRDDNFEGGFSVLHYDASNRDVQRDASTGWRARQV
jgi:hypothetical protein